MAVLPRWILPLLLAAVLLAPSAAAADQARVELVLPGGFELSQATLLAGHVELGESELRDPRVVEARSLELAGGTLYVCPVEPGRRGDVDPLPVLEEECRGEDVHEDPLLSFGQRTWLTFAGNYTIATAPNASMVAVYADAGGISVASVHSQDGYRVALDDGRVGFRPLISSSQVIVETDGEETSYNGTGWAFLFEGQGTMRLSGQGLTAGLEAPVQLTVGPSDLAALGQALQPRVLLDLQDAELGPDAREPAANATRLTRENARIPELVNGALFGYLNGTLDQGPLGDGEAIRLVAVEELTATLTPTQLTGQGSVAFQKGPEGFALGAGDPQDVPWWLSALAWIAFAGALFLGTRPPRLAARDRWVAVGLALGLVVVWDLRLASVLGTSGLTRIGQGGGLGELLALLGFELVALGLLVLLVFLPVGLGASRILADRWQPWVRPAVTALAGLYVLVLPGVVIAVGQLLARL